MPQNPFADLLGIGNGVSSHTHWLHKAKPAYASAAGFVSAADKYLASKCISSLPIAIGIELGPAHRSFSIKESHIQRISLRQQELQNTNRKQKLKKPF